MAIEKKRMQQRGGPYNQFDKSKTLPKEFQFVNSGDPNTSDGRAIYATFESGDPKRLSTYEDMSNDLALALAGLEEEYLGSITQATQNAINATSQASSAATAANQAADEANEIIDAFKEAVDGTVISDSSTSSSTAYSSQKIENDFLKKTGNGSNVTVTFQQAADRAGIQSGDSLAVAFGKLAKFCADIQDYVFSPPIASLASTDATRPLAASMGKRLNDDFTAKYNNLSSALDDRRTYCIDSGYTPRVEINMPAGTCALVCTEYGLYYVASLSTNYLNVPIFQSQDISEADRPIIIPYVDQRRIAIRRAKNTSENVRVLVITPFSTITKR